MTNFKTKITNHLLHIPGWHTRRKIVVIESDDWGSLRMPSAEVLQKLIKRDIRVDRLSYNRYDSLASEEDLEHLFEVLNSVKDKNGNPAVFTANTCVANPDFNKIESGDFNEYFYEPFTETLKRYPKHEDSFELWKEGMDSGVFRPQFHGREHLNVISWMKALQKNTGNVRLGFQHGMFDLSVSVKPTDDSFMQALNYVEKSELKSQKKSIQEGTDLFEKIFGYRSETFIAPTYVWSNDLNNTTYESGIKAFQGIWYQFEPIAGPGQKFKKKFHYTGEKNKQGQYYLVRNAAFEPADNPEFNWIAHVMQRAKIAFRMRKPLIIGSHRLNYIGFIDRKNRERNLPLLKQLLDTLLKKYPDIEFVSSDELYHIMAK